MPTLGLVMIARDAAALLPRMLAHHRALVDAITLVDTGSGDATATLAREAGADVVSFAWNDDFAAARNAGLAAATTDWILILDADELIAPSDFTALRDALGDGPRVLVQPTINYCDDPRHPQWRPVSGRHPHQEQGHAGCFVAQRAGVFPHRDDLRFTGCVHESILPAATRAALPVADLDVPVHHYGYVQGAARNAERRRFYRRLAERKLADNPDDLTAQLELAVILIEDGDVARARPLLAVVAAAPTSDSTVTQARFLWGRLLREDHDPAGAAAVLEQAVAADRRLIFGWIEWLRALGDQERWGEADRVLRQARAEFPADPLLDREELRCLIKTGRLTAAAKVVQRLARSHPHLVDLQRLAERLPRHAAGPKNDGSW